ncbi:MAG: type II transport protein [Firmicutes bacterium]|nr:type II transport protein [Bacillota bacterium]
MLGPTRSTEMGYTFIEVTAVLLISSLIFLLVAPRFVHGLADYQLQKSAEALVWQLRHERQAAIAEGTAHQIEFFVFGNKYRLFQPTLRDVPLDAGIEYAYISLPKDQFGRLTLIFNPLGTPNVGGTIALKNKYNQYRYVVVAPVIGRVRLSDTPP